MASRFYFAASGSVGGLTPAFDASWNQTGQAVRLPLQYKPTASVLNAIANGSAITIPITTTQFILWAQFISDPIPAQRLGGTFSLVIRCFENATTNNAFLAYIAKVVSQDGGTFRGYICSTPAGADSEFALSASAATRVDVARAVTATITQPGDRLVVEVGSRVSAPTAAGSFTMRSGYNAASDFALTTGLTTDLNPWCELSQDVFPPLTNNYQSCRAASGISVAERVR